MRRVVRSADIGSGITQFRTLMKDNPGVRSNALYIFTWNGTNILMTGQSIPAIDRDGMALSVEIFYTNSRHTITKRCTRYYNGSGSLVVGLEREYHMKLIVQKFGGSSVRDAQRLRNVAAIIADTRKRGNDLIVVLSAQGNTTDELLRKAYELSDEPAPRELDALLATGEQASVALCAILLEEMGLPAVSLSAWQVGIHTEHRHGNARIKRIETARILKELEQGRIVLVAGFQGVDAAEDITTLGRGGSDTSAVALAAAFDAQRCEIYTDVDGVYTADPRIVPCATRYDEIDCEEMLVLAQRGAKVLHSRSVELARDHGVDLEVLSSLVRGGGTRVAPQEALVLPHLAGVTRDGGVISVVGTGLDRLSRAVEMLCETLDESDITVLETERTERCVAVRVDEADAIRVLRLAHKVFFEQEQK